MEGCGSETHSLLKLLGSSRPGLMPRLFSACFFRLQCRKGIAYTSLELLISQRGNRVFLIMTGFRSHSKKRSGINQ